MVKLQRESHYLWEYFLKDKRDPIFSMPLDASDYEKAVSENNFNIKIFEELYHRHTFNNSFSGQISRIVKFREKAKPLFNWFLDFNKLWKEEVANLKSYRVIDKTPPNVFRVEFLNKVFPDAQFIYLKRSPEGNINSLIKAWQSKGKLFDFKFREFYDYNQKIDFENYDGKVWKFINPPGWEKFLEAPHKAKKWSLKEVCEFQYLEANKFASKSLNKICEGLNTQEHAEKIIEIDYENMIANKDKTFKEICDFLNIEFSEAMKLMIEKNPKPSQATK